MEARHLAPLPFRMNASADTVDTPLGRLPQAAVAAWLMLAMGAAMLASVPADLQAQALLSGVGLGLIIAFSHRATENPNDWRRSGVLVFGMFLSFRYMVWRTFNDRPPLSDPIGMLV